MRNLFSFLVHRRCLSTSSKIPLSHSPQPEVTKHSNFALQFLTSTCGLPLESARSVSEKNLQSVIDYFKDEGFTQSHIAKFIHKNPQLLRANVETILKPKVEFLKEKGFVGELLAEILVNSPKTINRSLSSQIKPSLELLRSYLGSDDKLIFAYRRCWWLFELNFKNILEPNIEILVKEGVPHNSIAKIITLKPGAMGKEHSKAIYAVNVVKTMGIQPTSAVFVHAFNVLMSLNESTWKKKMEFLQSLGWTEDDVLMAFKNFPQMMAYSEGKIRKSMDFYLNTVKLDLQTIIRYPNFLGYALDTRVRPRYIVYEILKSKNLINENKKFLSLLSGKDVSFLEKYVIKYEDNVPGLLDIYNTAKTAKKIDA